MMNTKIVLLVTLFTVSFGCAIGEACSSTISLAVFGSSNDWWIAVAPLHGSVDTASVELQEAGSSAWNTMVPNAGWGYWHLSSSSRFSLPLSFRLTASNGEQVTLASVVTSIRGGAVVSTNAQYGSSVDSSDAPSGQHNTHAPTDSSRGRHNTHAPTEASTRAPTHAATQAPTHAATQAPTHAATQAPTHAATQAPTHAATQAPTHAATHAPTQAATHAPTHAATQAPTRAATQAPTQRATSAPTQKATSAPSTDLCTVTPTSAEPIKLLVPLYVYPGSAWTSVANGQKAGVETIAIINPNNGPSSGPDSSYNTYMAQLSAAGVSMIGYVHTSYGSRAIADVIADINTYATKFTGLQGIFIDEASSSSSQISYYTQVYQAIMSHSGFVHAILNPGTQPDEGYLAISTNVVVFEDTASKWTSSFSSWVKCAPSAAAKSGYKYKFSAIAYAASQSQLSTLLSGMEAAGMGMVYVTDGAAGGATYNSLPSFYSTQVSDIVSLN